MLLQNIPIPHQPESRRAGVGEWHGLEGDNNDYVL